MAWLKSKFILILAVILSGSLSWPGGALAKTYTLRIGAGHPAGPAVYVTRLRDYFVPEVERRVAAETEHRINFIEGYGGSIAKVAETLEAVQAGLLDIGGYCTCFEPAKLFLHNFPYFVPFGPQDSVQAIRVTRAVYEQFPWLAAQFSERYGQELLALNGWDNYHLGTIEPWESVADLKGVKIGGAGPNLPWLEYAGSIPVQSTLPDGYMSLQTGVYSGWLMFPSAYLSFKFHEPAPNYTLIGFGAMGVVAITMNARSMKRLPPEVQKIIREVAVAYEAEAAEALQAGQVNGLAGLREAGANVRELPADVRAEWAESLKDFPNRMAKDADGRGMPGSAVMRAYIEAVKQDGYVWPKEYVIE